MSNACKRIKKNWFRSSEISRNRAKTKKFLKNQIVKKNRRDFKQILLPLYDADLNKIYSSRLAYRMCLSNGVFMEELNELFINTMFHDVDKVVYHKYRTKFVEGVKISISYNEDQLLYYKISEVLVKLTNCSYIDNHTAFEVHYKNTGFVIYIFNSDGIIKFGTKLVNHPSLYS